MTTQEMLREQLRFLTGGGEMGHLIGSTNWSGTPLGPAESWPQSLRTTVSLCLTTNFPMCIVWGPGHVMIYNDRYRPLCGKKHPVSMGEDFSECWASAWPVIGEPFLRALDGHASFIENRRVFLDRNGYLEETFFTFSFSPIRDETGGVGGVLSPCHETTATILSERRIRALADLTARTAKAKSVEEALTLTAQTLTDSELDVPFALLYTEDAIGRPRLVASTGPRHCPDIQEAAQSCWPVAEVFRSGSAQHIDAVGPLDPPHYSPYPEPAKSALLLPIVLPGAERPVIVLVAGVSPRLPLNEAYRSFYDLLSVGVTTAIARARACAAETMRAGALAEAQLKMARLRVEGDNAIRESDAKLALELADSQLLQRISSRLIVQDDINTLYDQILEAARLLMHSEFASLQKLVPERNELFQLASHGFAPESLKHWQWVAAHDSTSCGVAMKRGQPVTISDVEQWAEAAGTEDLRHFRLCGIRAVLSTPLIARDGQCVGMISTHWRQIHQPSERELRLLDVLARQAADLIERHTAQVALRQLNESLERRVNERTADLAQQTVRLQRLAAELMDSEERARRNLATILHDELQQILVAAIMQIPIEEKDSSLGRISALLKEAIAVSRSMVTELSPIPLRDSTLPEALGWLADWFADYHHHQIGVEVSADFPTLSEGSIRFVFDTVRELLFNSVKHAGVRAATVRALTAPGNALQVEVADNGNGFDPASVEDKDRSSGFGLYNIRERLIALGGGMEIQSAPGRGARFTLLLPFSGSCGPASASK